MWMDVDNKLIAGNVVLHMEVGWDVSKTAHRKTLMEESNLLVANAQNSPTTATENLLFSRYTFELLTGFPIAEAQ